MNTGEFYSSREHNYIGENNFPAELYRKPFEENPLGTELANLGEEVTTLTKSQPTTEGKGSSGAKSLVEQVFNSIRSVATAAVAVSAIVVTSTVMSSTASADLISIDVGDSYVEYAMDITDSSDDLFVILEAPGEKLSETQVLEDGLHQGRVEGLKPEWEYVLSLVSRDAVLGDITRFEHKFQTLKYQEPPPDSTASITSVTLADVNLVRVGFDTANVERLILRIDYPDDSYENIELTPEEISLGFANITVPETALEFTITPIIIFDESSIEGERFEVAFENNLEVDLIVRLHDLSSHIVFNIKAITNGATYLHVDSPLEYPATGDYYFDDWLYYSERAEMSFTLYLTDDTGAILSNQITLTVDTNQVESIPEYNMMYPNPSEVGITYNEDGTINVYVYTGFECADESYYSIVKLGDYIVRSRESVVAFENLPNDTYPINYDVCFDKDGISYAVMSVNPSGTVNEVYFNEYFELIGNEFTMHVTDINSFDLNALKVVSSSGEEIIITESNLVVDENGYLALRVSFSDSPEYVTLYGMYAPFITGLESVGEYKGSPYIPFEKVISAN